MTLASASIVEIPSAASPRRSGRRPPDKTAQSPGIHATAAAAGALVPPYRTMEQQQRSSASGPSEYPQSGLPSPYPSNGDNQSEASSSADQSAASYSTAQEVVRPHNYAPQPTPTSSEYAAYPTSARSSTFSERAFHPHHPASSHSGSSGGGALAHTPTSPSMPLQNGRSHPNSAQARSDTEVPIDPSIAASSPTYSQQYSPFPASALEHGYQPQPASASLYAQPRPEWGHYAQGGYSQATTPVTPSHSVFATAPANAVGHRSQVYSFVPIPGAQQHKRPRRRYEEIERMYKCGWNGCEKAYGTLNHLNAHVTMQGHGQKRTPEEFKEIRKEWKARKKEEEAQRKAAEEQHRQAAAASVAVAQNPGADSQPGSETARLPPIGNYTSPQYPPPTTASMQQQPLPSGYAYANYPPDSSYGSGQTMYSTQR